VTRLLDWVILAHGIGGRSDLPISEWRAVWGATVVLFLSFSALGLLWHRPKLRKLSRGRVVDFYGNRLGILSLGILRIFGFVLFLLVVSAGFFGTNLPVKNIAPVSVYAIFWVGVPFLSVLLGDCWRALSPWDTFGKMVDRAHRRPVSSAPTWLENGWAAVLPISVFHWLELAYHGGAEPRTLGWAALLYTLWLLILTQKYGWSAVRKAEGFAVLFSGFSALSPLHWREGRLHLRMPFSGLVELETRIPVVSVFLVALGGTTFDGVSRTRFWGDVMAGRSGWEATALNTIGLVWVVLLVGLAFHVSCRVGGRIAGDMFSVERFGASLVPILLGYHLAHYFSLLLLEGQAFRILLSDPYGRGWNLLGTIGDPINWELVSTTTVGWVQLIAIVIGHLVAVVVAHDRSVELWGPGMALRSQRPTLLVMVIYTMVALLLVAT